MEDNDVYKSVVIFLLTICVISLGLGIYANYRLIKISRENQKTEVKEEKKDDNKKVKDKEAEVTDSKIIEELNRRQDILNSMDANIEGINPHIYDKEDNLKTLTKNDKITSVLYYLLNKDEFNEEKAVNYPLVSIEGFYCGMVEDANKNVDIKNISFDTLNKTYKELYKEEINDRNFDEADNIPFVYSNDYEAYFYKGGCGTCFTKMLYNNYKYTEDENNYYLYTYVAYEDCSPIIYKDRERKVVVKNYSDDLTSFSDEKDVMETNEKELNHYKIVFIKDKDNIYFNKVEKVS